MAATLCKDFCDTACQGHGNPNEHLFPSKSLPRSTHFHAQSSAGHTRKILNQRHNQLYGKGLNHLLKGPLRCVNFDNKNYLLHFGSDLVKIHKNLFIIPSAFAREIVTNVLNTILL